MDAARADKVLELGAGVQAVYIPLGKFNNDAYEDFIGGVIPNSPTYGSATLQVYFGTASIEDRSDPMRFAAR